jgi:hypothetical protein
MGCTPLITVGGAGVMSTTALLLRSSTNINAGDSKKQSALILAAAQGQGQVV